MWLRSSSKSTHELTTFNENRRASIVADRCRRTAHRKLQRAKASDARMLACLQKSFIQRLLFAGHRKNSRRQMSQESELQRRQQESVVRCHNCEHRRNATRKLALVEPFPDCLIIHLKRFDNQLRKLTDPIDINEQVRLQSSDGRIAARYDLAAAVVHSGTLAHGHYCAITKMARDAFPWSLFSDSVQQPLAAFSHRGYDVRRTAYILFYHRRP
jgi:hypothetical protein